MGQHSLAPWIRMAGWCLVAVVVLTSGAAAIESELVIKPVGVPDEALGSSARSAGDFNGDGFADIIAGAPNNDAGGIDAGRAYLYYGGPASDEVADITFTGQNAGDEFGYSVSSAGDLNGDGFDDVVVGAQKYNSDEGRAYVYFGGANPDNGVDLTLVPQTAGGRFGAQVATIGDMNADGYSDIIVGSYLENVQRGKAYIYYGGPTPNSSFDLLLEGEGAGDRFGYVGPGGDFNGDGYSDAVVGAASYNGATGRAYVFFGSEAPDATADVTLDGEALLDQYGRAVSSAGDINGDGFDEVIVGAPDNSAVAFNAGRAYVYLGGSSMDSVADLTMSGEAERHKFGWSVGAAGDLDGNGYGDFVAGATQYGYPQTLGRAYVYLGSETPDGVADLTFTGTVGDQLGSAVASAGDVNGDGNDDLLIGAWQQNGALDGYLKVMTTFYFRVQIPNGSEQWVAGEDASIRWRGRDVADIDLSIDGGLTWETVASEVGGRVTNSLSLQVPSTITQDEAMVRVRLHGQEATRSTSDTSLEKFSIAMQIDPELVPSKLKIDPIGEAPGDNLGSASSSAGDVNGDGYDDIIAGAPLNDAGGLNAGRAYVYFGGPDADLIADLTLTGEAAGDEFGSAVHRAGDVNGDGYEDLLVGAPLNDAGGAEAGSAYLFFGGESPDAIADLTIIGEAAGDNLGAAVRAAGDVNADGYDDLIIGAPFSDAADNLVEGGRAYVFFGGGLPDAVPDLTFTGEAGGDHFGLAVSALDMNGDGAHDLLVGAPGNDAAGSAAGRAYVFLGGRDADNVADHIFTGEAAGDEFGHAVAAAGDFDADGFGDALIGAPLNDSKGADAGRAYLFYGGPLADSFSDYEFEVGNDASDQFGFALDGAGDVNADGFDDIIIGAPYADQNGADAGRAHVFLGGTGIRSRPVLRDQVVNGQPGDNLGFSVGGAGDLNADEFNDIIIGVLNDDSGDADAGKVMVLNFNQYHLEDPTESTGFLPIVWQVGSRRSIRLRSYRRFSMRMSFNSGRSFHRLQDQLNNVQLQDQIQDQIQDQRSMRVMGITVPNAPSAFVQLSAVTTIQDQLQDQFGNPRLPRGQSFSGIFAISGSVALLRLTAMQMEEGSNTLRWATEPAVSPEGIAGYRLYRLRGASAGTGTRIGPNLITDTEFTDTNGKPADSYRLFSVNGFGDELLLAECAPAPRAPLAAWPMPYRGGELTISFATAGGLGGGPGQAEVNLYDVTGRLVRKLAEGGFLAGHQQVVWDGTDSRGNQVAQGVYFLQTETLGHSEKIKLVVLR